MLVTLLGISILVKPSQNINAKSPILFTLLGISMLVKLLQPENAYLPMLVTLLGIDMLVMLLHAITNVFVVLSIIKLFSTL